MLSWCKSYLSNRFQCTLANGVTSDLLPVTCGVPQGSVLGPLFFLVYVNDVQNAVTNCGLKLYADDTVLYKAGINSNVACTQLQQSLGSIFEMVLSKSVNNQCQKDQADGIWE